MTQSLIERLPALPEPQGFGYDKWEYCFYTKRQMQEYALAAIEATQSALVAQPTEQNTWRCFHCDEVFHDAESAREHFGSRQLSDPACLIDIAEYRKMEARMQSYNEEDADIHRQLYAMQGKHAQDLLREEEKGYARGLKDAHLIAPVAQPVAWMTTRENDPTFPRVHKTEEEADLLLEYCNVNPPIHKVPLLASPPLQEQDQVDAARWRALIGSARIRALGSAGLTSETCPYGTPWNGYAHLGLEFWTIHDCTDKNELGIDWLTKYADIARTVQKVPA